MAKAATDCGRIDALLRLAGTAPESRPLVRAVFEKRAADDGGSLPITLSEFVEYWPVPIECAVARSVATVAGFIEAVVASGTSDNAYQLCRLLIEANPRDHSQAVITHVEDNLRSLPREQWDDEIAKRGPALNVAMALGPVRK